MVEGAWAVSRTASRPGARFRRLARRFGRLNIKNAAVAVAHTLLCVAWAVMKDDSDYAEAGSDYYDQLDQRITSTGLPPPAGPRPARLPGRPHTARRRKAAAQR
jgi:hypothetical protein